MGHPPRDPLPEVLGLRIQLPVAAGLCLLVLLTPCPAWAAEKTSFSLQDIDFFEKTVRPLLAGHCYECHSAGAKTLQGGLRLDNRTVMLAGGDSGAAIVPGKPNESLLIESVRYSEDSFQMPPEEKLPDAAIANLVRWVERGAPAPSDSAATPMKTGVDQETPSKHWAFLRPRRSPPPAVKDTDWPRSDIDRFVLSRMETASLSPSGEADRRVLIRRLFFDLTGLPPSYEEVEQFVADSEPDTVSRLVDRLLASLHFGERWARHWLDVARYSDTKGYVFREEREYSSAFTYRDWVIQAFNEDMPYDRFLVEQIAADRLVDRGEKATAAAMGFLTLGRRFLNRQPDIIDDRIDVLCRGTMALTVACARCHDHKYDPVPMADYYSLYGVFASSTEPKNDVIPVGLKDSENAITPRIFIRGNPRNPGDAVPRRFLLVIAGAARQPFKDGSGRLEMAQAIANPDNPLTARVMVNRVWGHLFGRGLVNTPSDFGLRSDPPSHPQLLDNLAVEFVENGWSVKQLIRRIVLSNTYRQASDDRANCRAADPENRLVWRMNRRRLDFETVRDSLLVAAGRLDRTVGGQSVKLTDQPAPTRRTLYAFIDRQNLPGVMRAFDFANPDQHAPKRHETTVPQQALYLMNSPFAMEQAEHLAGRTVTAGPDTAERVRQLCRFVNARDPHDDELAVAAAFIGGESPDGSMDNTGSRGAWQYGYGEFDEPKKRLKSFEALPHFTGTAWQGGSELPDPKLGWVILNAQGGHPGNDPQHAAVRRWISPFDGQIVIRGELKHPSDQGDGVRARVVSDRTGLAGEWVAQNGSAGTSIEQLDVQEGDAVDFVVDCRAHPNFDGFSWIAEIVRTPSVAGYPNVWKNADGFRGPPAQRLGPWARLAQVLLMSNEFMFVD